MFSVNQFCRCCRNGALLLPGVVVTVLLVNVTAPSAAQIHGIPPSVTSIQNHFPPYLPNVPASVTSLGPHGYVGPPAFPVYPPFTGRLGYGFGRGFGGGRGNGYGYGHRNNNYGYSGGAWIGSYYPAYDASYGGDAEGGGAPYMYTGPPEQTLHVVVDMPPARQSVAEDDEAPTASRPRRESDAAELAEATPIDPTVLIFRDGHKQEVINYAIVGQTVYVFDKRTQKIAITDLDVAATVKANDDRGVEFHVPARTKS